MACGSKPRLDIWSQKGPGYMEAGIWSEKGKRGGERVTRGKRACVST